MVVVGVCPALELPQTVGGPKSPSSIYPTRATFLGSDEYISDLERTRSQNLPSEPSHPVEENEHSIIRMAVVRCIEILVYVAPYLHTNA